MLVLSRKPNESVIVDGPCRITVLKSACKLGIEGSAKVIRAELLPEETALDRTPPTVYMLDDDADILDAYQQYLEHFGLTVKPFRSGEEFLAQIQRASDASVAVVDLRLAEEDIDGLQVVQQLREWKHDYPVIMLTGYGDVDTCRRAFLNGCYTFLQKPLPPDDLVTMVKEAASDYVQRKLALLNSLAG